MASAASEFGACVQELADGNDSEISPGILRAPEIAHRRFDHNLLAVDPGRHVVFGGDEKRGALWVFASA